MGDDTAGEAHVQLAAARQHVRAHCFGVAEITNRNAVRFLIAEVDDAISKEIEIGAALDVQSGESVGGQRLQKARGAELLEQGAKASGGSDGRETMSARELGVFCISVSLTILMMIKSLALDLTLVGVGEDARDLALADPVGQDPHRGGGGGAVGLLRGGEVGARGRAKQEALHRYRYRRVW